MNALCLTIDGLQAGYLGCYGNGWIRTPAMNALAAGGFVFDNALIDSPDSAALLRSWWKGSHSAGRSDDGRNADVLLRTLQGSGVSTWLVTDDSQVAAHPLAAEFAETVLVPEAAGGTPAPDEDDTQFARFFAALIEAVQAARPPFFLCAHLQGLLGRWDAPFEFRAQYADAGDPRPDSFVEPPNYLVTPDADPDELLGVRQAYAGQVSLLDAWLGLFADWLDSQPMRDETLLLLQGARGFPLGIHGSVGFRNAACGAALFSELIHVPLIVRMPGSVGAACRSSALVQPPDVAASLAEWFGVPSDENPTDAGKSWLPLIRGKALELRDRACVVAPSGESALRTRAWHLRQPNGGLAELYAKPDDRHEINEISALRPGVTQSMQQALAAWLAAARGEADLPPALEEELAAAFHD